MDSKLKDIVRKIEALLEKSHSTTYPDEAIALQQKAQELMTKYQVEGHELFGSGKNGEIIQLRFDVDGPYILDKITLLHAIAKNNYCRVLRGKTYATIYGYESDIELVMVMYRMLLIDMASSMIHELEAIKIQRPDINTTSWKKSFFAGYASVINTRLALAKKEQMTVARHSGNDNFALVLKDKESLIQQYWESIPRSPAAYRSVGSNAGFDSGRSSATSADIGQSRISGSKSLNR